MTGGRNILGAVCAKKRAGRTYCPNLLPIKVEIMSSKYDPDERFSLDADPEEALESILGGAGTEGEEVEMDDPEESEPG
jgi:hypothetical protein